MEFVAVVAARVAVEAVPEMLPVMVPVAVMLPVVMIFPVTLTLPVTSSLEPGVVVPIPTLPELLMNILLVPVVLGLAVVPPVLKS